MKRHILVSLSKVFLTVYGEPGRPLIHSVRSPVEVIEATADSEMRPNAVYYITKVIIPVLNR